MMLILMLMLSIKSKKRKDCIEGKKDCGNESTKLKLFTGLIFQENRSTETFIPTKSPSF